MSLSVRPTALLLFLSLFVVSANSAWGFGRDEAGQATQTRHDVPEKSCCSKPTTPSSRDHQADLQHAAADCPCDHEDGGCQCPGCGIAGYSGGALVLGSLPTFATQLLAVSVQKMAFYFADHLPEAVYLPIWQPPQPSACCRVSPT